jgi:hypothetical protein
MATAPRRGSGSGEGASLTASVAVKRHRGKPGHTRDTRDTRTHKGTQTNLTTNHTHQQHTPRTSARRPKPRPTQQPQARSRPLPAADSEEAAPSKPDPASARSQSASPRLLEGGRRNRYHVNAPHSQEWGTDCDAAFLIFPTLSLTDSARRVTPEESCVRCEAEGAHI